MDIRQSPEYAQFIKSLGWTVEKISPGQVFIKKFPLIGSLIKIQRITSLDFTEIETLAQKHHALQVIIDPSLLTPDTLLTSQPHYKHLKSPFIPTKTLILDLKKSEKEIFDSFSKNKRRDIRLAERKNIVVKEGNLEDFLKLKKEYLLKKFILPIGVKNDLEKLLEAFGQKAKILIGYLDNRPVGGELLLINEGTCYYWQAAATEKGKKNLAPTILVWEAIKLAKKLKCQTFDFEGVYDDRFPGNKSWQGFTHFKEGFRGKEIVYPHPIIKNNLFILNLF